MKSPKWTKYKKYALGFVILMGVVLVCTAGAQKEISEKGENKGIEKQLIEGLEENILHHLLPLFPFAKGVSTGEVRNLEMALFDVLPVFSFIKEEQTIHSLTQDQTTGTLLTDAGSFTEEDTEKEPDHTVSENQVSDNEVEEALTLEEAMMNENQNALENTVSENEAETPIVSEQVVVPPIKQMEYHWEDFPDFNSLFSTFYAIDSSTMIDGSQINLDSLLSPDITIKKTDPGPQILIYHTHSQETFVDSIPGDASTTIMGAGEKLEKVLTEVYGYSVLYHRGLYDVENRDGAYSKSLPEIEKILQENPSIQVVIDLHRDEVAADRKLVVDINGKPTAQFMFFNGLSRTTKTGDIPYLVNQYQKENLSFSFKMQVASNEYYPGITRRIYLKGYRYNMHLKPRTLLIELGAQTNTLEEILNAIDPLAHVLDVVLSGE